MSNLVFFELLNRFDISAYLFGITSILLFAFTYKLSLKGLIYKVYLLHLCVGLLYIYEEASYNMTMVADIVYKHSWNDIVSVIDKNKQLAGLVGTIVNYDENNMLVRTNKMIDRNYDDMFVYRKVDMTRYKPHDLSPNRWEQTIKDIEYIRDNTHNNLIYGELPLVIKDMVYKLNYVINPWSYFGILDNSIITSSFIKSPIIYMEYIDNEYVYNVEYLYVSLLSVALIFGYVLYMLVSMCNKKNG
jgi:hypothetical protein